MSPRLILLAPLAAMLVAGLSGCVTPENGAAGEPDLPADYAAAQAAPGQVYTPKDSDSSIRLKLLHPADPMNADEGDTWVVVLLYDNATDTPVTDADFEIEARMEAMGHGTAGEKHPEHRHDGIYVGMTDFIMGGEWTVNLDPRLADGTDLEFDITVMVGGGDGMDGM